MFQDIYFFIIFCKPSCFVKRPLLLYFVETQLVIFYSCDYLREMFHDDFSIHFTGRSGKHARFIITAQGPTDKYIQFFSFFFSRKRRYSVVSVTDGQRLNWTLVSGDEARVSPSNFLFLLCPIPVLHCWFGIHSRRSLSDFSSHFGISSVPYPVEAGPLGQRGGAGAGMLGTRARIANVCPIRESMCWLVWWFVGGRRFSRVTTFWVVACFDGVSIAGCPHVQGGSEEDQNLVLLGR